MRPSGNFRVSSILVVHIVRILPSGGSAVQRRTRSDSRSTVHRTRATSDPSAIASRRGLEYQRAAPFCEAHVTLQSRSSSFLFFFFSSLTDSFLAHIHPPSRPSDTSPLLRRLPYTSRRPFLTCRTVASPRHLASLLRVTLSSSHVAPLPLVQSHPLHPLNARRMLVRLIFLFSFSFTDSLSLTCIPSCSFFRHASTLSRSPSPRVCHASPPRHALPLVTCCIVPCHALPRRCGIQFGPAVN